MRSVATTAHSPSTSPAATVSATAIAVLTALADSANKETGRSHPVVPYLVFRQAPGDPDVQHGDLEEGPILRNETARGGKMVRDLPRSRSGMKQALLAELGLIVLSLEDWIHLTAHQTTPS